MASLGRLRIGLAGDAARLPALSLGMVAPGWSSAAPASTKPQSIGGDASAPLIVTLTLV